MSYAAVVVGVLASLLAATRSVPQLVRIWRHGHARGVSLPSLWVGAVSGVGWTTYGVLADQPSVVIASLASAAVYLSTVLVAQRHLRGTGTFTPLLWAGALVLVLWSAGTAAFGLTLAASAVVTGMPQLRRVRAKGDLSGVSALTWSGCLLEGLLWLAVGVGTRDVAVLAWAVGQLGVSAAILLGLGLRPRRRALVAG